MVMRNKDGSWISSAGVTFSSPMKYEIGYCTNGETDLPVQPPTEVDKIWAFIKTETALIIKCNNVEVLNYLFEDSPRDGCFQKLGGDVVENIVFHNTYDEASDFYKAGKALDNVQT